MLIFLIGLPGSGKTTLGKQLAERLGYTFIDTDEEIVKKQGRSIPDIFTQDGEDKFRVMEKEILEEVSTGDNKVISTGGGLPCFHQNMFLIRNKGVAVYLRVSADELTRRLTSVENAHRPLVKGKSPAEVTDFLLEKLKEREPYYLLAQRVLQNDQLSVQDLLIALKVQ